MEGDEIEQERRVGRDHRGAQITMEAELGSQEPDVDPGDGGVRHDDRHRADQDPVHDEDDGAGERIVRRRTTEVIVSESTTSADAT